MLQVNGSKKLIKPKKKFPKTWRSCKLRNILGQGIISLASEGCSVDVKNSVLSMVCVMSGRGSRPST